MKRGFTIIEVIVVITVLAILITLSAVSMSAYQRQADDAATKSVAASIRSGMEQYYAKNNEYPVPNQLMGTTSDFSGPPSDSVYDILSRNINVPTTTLNGRVKAVVCHTACLGSNLNKKYTYYLNKYGSSEMTAYNYVFESCTYTLPNTEAGGSAYIIAYWSNDANKWQIAKSNRGTVNTSNSTNCPFTAL